ncbi:hypothetical protein D7Z26_18535 [Cohnella endophytica]|uniref:Uncharacterized protein n=1 Tax=Cohnella endophytica TaxID=2419778 RepID=A0A494XQN4_9BACL|nr:hypothetical protein [Cohnella endophytica]RKP49833.1 hypothetical protein D7Z26_18535 [Cohnella endophytica]
MEKVRILRFSNDGFKTYDYTSSHYNIYLDQYQRDVKYFEEANFIGLKCCYAFYYVFDEQDVQPGSKLSLRNGNQVNTAYLPLDHVVYVRNMRPDGTRIVRGYKKVLNPTDNNLHEFEDDSIYDYLKWVRMSLRLALQRSREYMTLTGKTTVPEILSEMLLTQIDVDRLEQVVHYPFSPLFSRKKWWNTPATI